MKMQTTTIDSTGSHDEIIDHHDNSPTISSQPEHTLHNITSPSETDGLQRLEQAILRLEKAVDTAKEKCTNEKETRVEVIAELDKQLSKIETIMNNQ